MGFRPPPSVTPPQGLGEGAQICHNCSATLISNPHILPRAHLTAYLGLSACAGSGLASDRCQRCWCHSVSMTVTIHHLGDADWNQLREIRLASLADAPGAFWASYNDEAAFGEDDWKGFASGVAWLVAVRSDVTVGVVGVMPSELDLTVEPQIIGMWVHPDARRQGVGVQLLDAARRRLTERGAHSVALWVTDQNPGAQALYETYGFRLTAVTAPLPPGREGLQQELRLLLEPE